MNQKPSVNYTQNWPVEELLEAKKAARKLGLSYRAWMRAAAQVAIQHPELVKKEAQCDQHRGN